MTVKMVLKKLTVHEISELLSVSPASVYYWVQRGDIPYIRVGKHLRFDPEEVMNYFRMKTIETDDACKPALRKLETSRQTRSLTIEDENS